MMHRNYALWRWAWYALYAAGGLVILAFWWHATGRHTATTRAALEIAAGNITGLIGTYAILWQLVLLGRLVPLENVFGLEKLTWLHKWNGYLALTFIILHTAFLVWGYGAFAHAGFTKQLLDFMFSWADVLKASIGTAILVVAVLMSIGIVRRGFQYETWYFVHLFIYLAVLLAFSHQLSVGSDLAGNRAFQIYWYALYVASIGILLFYRFVRPIWGMYHQDFRVERVERETHNVVSIYISGRHLERLHYQAGQFMIWRFFNKALWWQAHPFSISVAPGGRDLRLTVKQLGDFTRALSDLKPGTPVMVDGPHGHFTAELLTNPQLLLIAGGVGITPIRSLLEQLPAGKQNAVLVYAGRTRADLPLRREIDALAKRAGVTVHYLLSNETAPGYTHGQLTSASLAALVPDAAAREVMLCGPVAMMDDVTAALKRAGVSRRHIHTERFAY